MGNYVSEQLALFLRSALLGGVLGLVYDLLRAVRRLGGGVLGGVLDALYCLLSAAAVFFFVMAGDGELRIFILLGAGGLVRAYTQSAKDALDAAGISVLFFCLLSQPLRPLWDFWLELALAPLRLLGSILKKCGIVFKKLFSFFQRWFTIIHKKARGVWSGGKGRENSLGEKRRKKHAKASQRQADGPDSGSPPSGHRRAGVPPERAAGDGPGGAGSV